MSTAPRQSTTIVIVAHRVALPVEPPERFLIAPWGEIESNRLTIIDETSAAAIVERFEAHGADIPIDLDHQTVLRVPPAPDGSRRAVGWIKGLEVVPGEGIFASNVEWTERGASMIRSKEYRYPSGAFVHVGSSPRPKALHSVGLTNKPGMPDMAPIVSREQEVINMDPKFDQSRWFLNLETTATEEEILMKMEEFLVQLREVAETETNSDQAVVLAAIKGKVATAKAAGELRATFCNAAGVDVKAKDEEIVAAVNSLRAPGPGEPDPAKFVSMESHSEVASQLQAAQKDIREIRSEAFLKKGRDQGRISTHSEKQWQDKYVADPEQAEKDLTLVPEGTFPKDGRITAHTEGAAGGAGGEGRGSLIAQGKAEYRENKASLPCSEKEYVNQTLSEHSEGLLTDAEVATHTVAA